MGNIKLCNISMRRQTKKSLKIPTKCCISSSSIIKSKIALYLGIALYFRPHNLPLKIFCLRNLPSIQLLLNCSPIF